MTGQVHGRHEACVCGDINPCSCGAPSPGWRPPDWWLATHADLRLVHNAIAALDRALSKDTKKLERLIMATQADIDALTAAFAQEDSDLNAAVASLTAADTAIAAAIAALQAANPALDLSGLQAELANSQAASAAVASAVSATAALVPPAA